jgi:hypothetical protein
MGILENKLTAYADKAWFEHWNKHHKVAFMDALHKALLRIEDSGVNLVELFSPKLAAPENEKQAA